ncbi:CbrC family protein [Roseibium sediminis]|uniref:CbrC family protein n=1 Tax=Roseibium sediminis TaxID=1775174 RepID=UPI00123CBBD5|nr:CbrC family protein [Roseibium sediminis]
MELPYFEYYPDPVGNGSIVEKSATCPCCQQRRTFMYVGPIYCIEEVEEVCPWCIHDGSAADKWGANFNDIIHAPSGVPEHILVTVASRTPGYVSWQDNKWLFSHNDALVFRGDVVGKDLIKRNETAKISACRAALAEFKFPEDFDLSNVVFGGQPAIYLFQDRATGQYHAYADMT